MIFLKQKPERGKNCKHILGRSMFLSFIIIFVLAACAKKNQSTNVPTPTQNEAISPVQTPSSSPTSSSSPSQVLTGELLTPTNDRVAIEEGNLSAYVSKIDDAVSGGFVVTVENKEGESVKILLNENVSHVEKIEFLPDNQLEVIGRVDPEFLACEIFDIDAGDLIGIYYGYGFTHLENGGMIYVLPGPHFSGNDRGSDKIVDQSGNILYESEPGVRIMKTQSLGDDALTLVDGCVYFEERSEGGPTVERVVNITIDEVLPSPSPSPLPLPIPVLSDDELQTMSVNTTYSPNGKYFIESYGVNPDMISGIYPIRDIRIVEVSGEKTVWNMGSSARGAEYIWSSNSRYVSVSYWGRIWGSALIVDTITMSEQELPGMTELAPMFPDVPPSDNRPDPYVKPQYWLDDCRIRVAFSWKSYDATSTEVDKMNGLTYTEGGEISGIYTYNVNAGEFVVEEDNMSELIFDED